MSVNKWIIYIVSGLFILSGFYCVISLAYTSFENVSAKDLDTKIANRKKDLEKASQEEASLSEWRNIGEHFDKFKVDYLMKMEDFSRFRDDLQVTFNRHQLSYKRPPQYKYKRLLKNYTRVEVSFTVNGSYPKLKRFIHEIINQEKMILIKRIQFSKNMQRGDITAKFIMEVYLAR